MRLRSLIFSSLLLIFVLPAVAQTKKTSSKPANVQAGTLVSVDAAAATVVLKTKAGADITYRLTEKTHILRDKKSVEAGELKAGEAIVVRFRKSSVGPASLYDLADKHSWEWLNKLRHERTLVTVKEISDEALHAIEGTDKAEVDYRVTDKTKWSKSDKPAEPKDFKAGDKVYVEPRMLPNGAIMAIGIADSATSAAKLKEQSKFTVTGLVKVINTEKRLLNIHTVAGDDRELSIAADCTVRQASKDVPLTAIKPSQTVTAHLTRNDEGEQVANKITIQSKKTTAKRPPTKTLPKKTTAAVGGGG
jgi:hypothetical protein